ncbi:MAG TPA: EAL domain-containing protein [Gemmatimonadaceae bacterium]|nr:EAL domain-containing protein [Gemmatimonadaceae bacterium]
MKSPSERADCPDEAAVAAPPASYAPPPSPLAAPLDGALAASLERLARVGAAALGASTTMVALQGTDRRCLVTGARFREWFAHDAGMLYRLRLHTQLEETHGPVLVSDTSGRSAHPVARALAELGVQAYAGAPILDPSGSIAGVFFALHDTPREWTERDRTILLELTGIAADDLRVRRQLVDRESLADQMRYHAMHDPLTGLPNRAFFSERLRYVLANAKERPGAQFAVIFLDLDDFKVVNDSIGHHAGDELLVAVARRIESCIRSVDLVARLGGDEFAVLVHDVHDVSDAARLAERIRAELAAPVNVGGYQFFTSGSIGIALSGAAGDRAEYLLRSADMAMYRAKRQGGGRFEIFDRPMHVEVLQRLQTETDLRRALERNEFILYYQPIVSLETNRIHAFEALVRWQHPERGLVSAGEFVPLAEATGLIVPISDLALRDALQQLRHWHDRHPHLRDLAISVNISGKQLVQPGLASHIATMLENTGVPPACLQIEITEGVMLGRNDRVLAALHELKAHGVKLHLDDFGTGYSSLSYLSMLPLDALKIDRAFLAGIPDDERQGSLVHTIVALARSLGLAAIAEGVEKREQYDCLRAMECQLAQGYLFSPALDAVAAEAMLVASVNTPALQPSR